MALIPVPVPVRPSVTRSLAIAHAHSSENFNGVYWKDGHYVDTAIEQLNFLLRDRTRGGVVTPIRPALFDLLHDLGREIGSADPFLLVSGYRAPKKTRDRLDPHHSLHMDGMAVDVRTPSRNLSQVRRTAVALQRGGVGFYGGNAGHLHLDVGPVRIWG